MSTIASEKKDTDDSGVSRNKPNKAVSILLVLLAIFYSFHNPQFNLPTSIATASLEGSALPKSPAIEANHAVEFISRGLARLGAASGSDPETSPRELALAFESKLNSLKPKPFYLAVAISHRLRISASEGQPRAPPADLT